MLPVSRQPRPEEVAELFRLAIEPEAGGFVNAIQIYPYTIGALYQVYTAPEQVTDIALQPGEELMSVSAGDTVRWVLGDTVSGSGDSEQVHILVKPTRPDITTNLVINTDRRTYHIELRANARVYMASVSWSYPQDELIALRNRNAVAASAAPAATGTLADSSACAALRSMARRALLLRGVSSQVSSFDVLYPYT